MTSREEVIEALKGWRLREVVKRAEDPEVLSTVLEVLKKGDPLLQKNALYVIKKLALKGKLQRRDAEQVLNGVISLVHSKDESVALQAIMTLNTILSTTELSPETYSEAMEVLMRVTSSGKMLLSEYAAEGLGTIGAKLLSLARRILSWVFSVVTKEKNPEVKAAAMEVLSTVVERTQNPQILEEGLNTALRLLDEGDPVVKNIALDVIDKALHREGLLSKEALQNASDVLERAGQTSLKERADALLSTPPKQPVGGAEKHTVETIKRMFEMEKHPYVLELARRDYEVLRIVIRIFLSEDLMTRLDALWVLSNAASYVKLDDALKILPTLEEMAGSDNPWIRSTSVKVFAALAVKYPSILDRAVNFVLSGLDSGEPSKVKGALELFEMLTSRVANLGLMKTVIEKIIPFVENDALRGIALEFLQNHEADVEELDPELKKKVALALSRAALKEKLKTGA